MKTKNITKLFSLMLTVMMCVLLASCGKQSAVDIVRNGEFNSYPGKPLEKTIIDFVDKSDEVSMGKMKWEDASDTFESVLDENESMVRCEFTLTVSGQEENYILTFLVDDEKQTFQPFSISLDGEVYTDSSDLNNFYEGIFGDS